MSSSSESRRRGRDDDHCHEDNAAGKKPRQRQKHLYLVMDDWDLGYSIHKLDVDAFQSSDAKDDQPPWRRLPEPSAVRIAAPEDRSAAYFAALGSKILAVADRFVDEDPMLVYDTETASLAVGPRPTPALLPGGFIFHVEVQVDDDDQQHRRRLLYALNPRRPDHQHCSFEVISQAPRAVVDWRVAPMARRADRWTVESVHAPMPFHKHDLVTAYAVHPDGRNVLVSVRNRATRKEGTWAFDVTATAWTWRGEWALPFRNQGCFVDALGAWVGLRADGFLCACDVVAPRGVMPEWRLGKKSMFREDPESHVGQPGGATLTYMGDSRFCLVECAVRQGVDLVDAISGEVDGCVLHVTVFGVDYNNTGALLLTTVQSSRSYLVTRVVGRRPDRAMNSAHEGSPLHIVFLALSPMPAVHPLLFLLLNCREHHCGRRCCRACCVLSAFYMFHPTLSPRPCCVQPLRAASL
ncbi:hypothetical protein QOZ80_4BG0336230 [Eleusine coracana subsp. coracana]|nr:hypothetical protein QOZ80_4BG0336230 [Eleusine coracana subsp. coracana]